MAQAAFCGELLFEFLLNYGAAHGTETAKKLVTFFDDALERPEVHKEIHNRRERRKRGN